MTYEDFDPDDLILRDWLAMDRTRLANERTFLAYCRTALMLVVSGVTLLKLFVGSRPMLVLGWVLIPGGLLTGLIGTQHFLAVRRNLNRCARRRQQSEAKTL